MIALGRILSRMLFFAALGLLIWAFLSFSVDAHDCWIARAACALPPNT
jgi:hypothetical protein